MKWTTVLIAAMSISCSAADKPEQPAEVGTVQWKRSYPSALKAAKAEKKPLLILFQEVPG